MKTTNNGNRFGWLTRALAVTAVVSATNAASAQPSASKPPLPPPVSPIVQPARGPVPSNAAVVATPDAATPGTEGGPVMTLNDAIARGRGNAPSLTIARAQVTVAKSREDSAAIPLRPTLTGSFGYTASGSALTPTPMNFGSSTGGSANNYFAPTNQLALSLIGRWRLYDFGQVGAAVRSAEASTHAALVNVDSATIDLMESIEIAYFQAVAAKQLVAVAQSTVASETRHLDEGQRLVNAGAQAEVALAQIRAILAASQVTLVQAQNNADNALVSLAQAIGDGQGVNFSIEDNWGDPVPNEDADSNTLLKIAAEHSLAVIVQTANRDAAMAALESARHTNRPTIDASGQLNGGLDVANSSDGNLYTTSWSLGAAISWEFADGGQRRYAIDLAAGNLAAAEGTLAAAMLQLRTDVETARLAVRAAKSQRVSVASSLAAAKESLRLAEASFTAGAGTATQLADAEVNVTTAAGQTVTADQQLATARAQLRHALAVPDNAARK